jgi:hypothetical protein
MHGDNRYRGTHGGNIQLHEQAAAKLGLRAMQALRGAGEAAQLGNCYEGADFVVSIDQEP